MQRALKTKEVAKALGVSSRTIQRWVRNFNIPYETNAQGHFQFNEEHIKMLEHIRDQMHNGSLAATKEAAPKEEKKEALAPENFFQEEPEKGGAQEERLNRIEDRLLHVEHLLSSKADQVVYEQVLAHRRELETLNSQLERLENKLASLEEKIKSIKPLLENKGTEKKSRRFFLFSTAR